MRKYLGIEFGSTRIKADLIDENHNIIAIGAYNWENQLVNGVWTYSLDLAKEGLVSCYKELKNEYEKKYKEKLKHIDAIGISGMMHGYLVFDKDDNQLAEFRTWRNTITEKASKILTDSFKFQIPQRWSIAHIYQSILNKSKEVNDIHFATTLCGYFHYLLTGEKVLGIGEASGMFPINLSTLDYDKEDIKKFNELIKNEVDWKIENILPKALIAGENAGYLTKEGALLIDPDGDLEYGIPLCPPEGDMGTGMVCTNSVRPGTGNASIGTSSNITLVTDRNIGIYEEIDVILTPSGKSAALAHVNNGTSEINAWEKLFYDVAHNFNSNVNDGDVFKYMFESALNGDKDCYGLYSVDYLSGEPVAKVNEGKLLSIREPDANMSFDNFVRSHIYSLLAPIRLGVDILRENENVKVNKIVGHGGYFKTPKVGQALLSAALSVPVITLPSAGEGGPYGQALLASYLIDKRKNESLEDFLDRVFANQNSTEIMANKEDIDGFNKYMEGYKKALYIERETINAFKKGQTSPYYNLKKEVYDANMRLPNEHLVILTWGNVSKIDRERKVVCIKPSGVPYEKLKVEDMVVVDLDGKIVDGKYNPSSDTTIHLELYKNFPEIGSVVHTHSTYAVAFAQARKDIKIYGTTHADTFAYDIPCTRELAKKEIEGDFELATGKVIVETFKNKDYKSIPGVIVSSHGPFTWGKDEKESVNNAIILEEIAKMAVLTEKINPEAKRVNDDIIHKHYYRKHGKNKTYGQKED